MRALSFILGILTLLGAVAAAQNTFSITTRAQNTAARSVDLSGDDLAIDELPMAPSAAVSSSRDTKTDPAALPAAPSTTQQQVQHERFLERIDVAPDLQPRLSAQDKFQIFVADSQSPFTFAAAGFSAGLAQATNSTPGFGQGWSAYGSRYRVALADSESSAFFSKFLIPMLARQDPRFKRNGREAFLPRLFDALSQIAETVDDDGDPQFNYSQVLGTVLSASIANAYYPAQSRGFGRTANRAVHGLGGAAGANVLREFWPDVKRMLFRHRKVNEREIEALSWHSGSQPSITPQR